MVQPLASDVTTRLIDFLLGRLLKLAQLHVLLPEPSYPPAVHIASRSQEYVLEAKQCAETLAEDQDLFYQLRVKDVTRIETQVDVLDRGIKRAWFATTNKKPIFFDLAFNYVDLPMDDLEKAAGREPSKPPATEGIIGSAVAQLPESIRGSVANVGEVIEQKLAPAAARLLPGTGVSRGRESTPAPEAEDAGDVEEGRQPETPSKSGWFGGFFGSRK
jgi:signal recognition particle subunit SRP68